MCGIYKKDKSNNMKEILLQLYALPAYHWGLYTLSTDLLYHRMGESLRYQSVRNAQRSGQTAARVMALREQCRQPEILCRRYGIRIDDENVENACGRYVLAQFQEPCDIVLYDQPIRKLHGFLKRNIPEKADFPVKELILAHEFYHVLELKDPNLAPEEIRVTVLKLGSFSLKRKIAAVSEIAAMAFAQELLGVPFAPQLLNLLLLFAEEDPNAEMEARQVLAMR